MFSSIRLADAFLRTVGPGHILIVARGNSPIAGELRRRGCRVDQTDSYALSLDGSAAAFDRLDSILLIDTAPSLIESPSALISILHALRPRFLAIATGEPAIASPAKLSAPSSSWAEALLATGFRRSPAAFSVADYEALNRPQVGPLTVYERIDLAVLTKWPLERLLAERDLHMDMSREFSGRADAHMVRYALAAQWVRPGDLVLDCACGLGYGTAILAGQSAGRRFVGVDIDRHVIDYARDNFAHYGVEYRVASGTTLDFLADASVDFIASFETIEHVEDYDALIDEFARVLKPDGRIIASVPNLWVDETGRDPNPHHFHAFDYAKFRSALARRFLVEARYRQEAPGGFKLSDAQRALSRRPLDSEEPDTEWWIIVASANPLRADTAAFNHPGFDTSSCKMAVLAQFAEHYANPWLYRTVVQMGERVADPGLLRTLSLEVLGTSAPATPDFGAAATVLGYQMLENGESQQLDDLLAICTEYATTKTDNAHVFRWQISLAYVCALNCLAAGRRIEARGWFDAVAARDALAFSPLLATKTVAAGFWRAMLRLVDGETAQARVALTDAIEAAAVALRNTSEAAIGRQDRPLTFGFQELAEVADMAGQCAAALHHLDDFSRAPGKFWSRVDVRRFGLATWCLHLEQENKRLLEQVHTLLAQRPQNDRGRSCLSLGTSEALVD